MAIKNFSLSLSALSFAFALTACQTMAPKIETVHDAGAAPATAQPASPPPTREEPKKVAVILGPGGGKALAHVGVLRALIQKRIPIQKVVGLEWGALVGGLFASKGQIHDAEWKLYKMQQKNLPRPPSRGFFSKGDESVKIMDEFLSESFEKQNVNDAKLSFECPSRSIWSGVVSWQTRGQFKDAVKRCLPFPPVFKAAGTFIAGPSQAQETIERLRSEGFNVIILVNVLGNAMPTAQEGLLDNLNYVILWQEIKRSLAEAERLNVDVINVNTNAYPILQFDAGKDLANLGENEGNTAADRLISKYGF